MRARLPLLTPDAAPAARDVRAGEWVVQPRDVPARPSAGSSVAGSTASPRTVDPAALPVNVRPLSGPVDTTRCASLRRAERNFARSLLRHASPSESHPQATGSWFDPSCDWSHITSRSRCSALALMEACRLLMKSAWLACGRASLAAWSCGSLARTSVVSAGAPSTPSPIKAVPPAPGSGSDSDRPVSTSWTGEPPASPPPGCCMSPRLSMAAFRGPRVPWDTKPIAWRSVAAASRLSCSRSSASESSACRMVESATEKAAVAPAMLITAPTAMASTIRSRVSSF
mmetsp:Transcript_23353/g.88592  ORF Transcript_23353/g.88592 Transcript_23353/m.88592 type:complete len:285 (-) Transcript_23353:1171-2025(-)